MFFAQNNGVFVKNYLLYTLFYVRIIKIKGGI